MIFPDHWNFLEHETHDNDLEALRELVPTPHGSVVVEIGSWVGGTAWALSEAFATVYCIDHFKGNPGDRIGFLANRYGPEFVFRTFCKNVTSSPDHTSLYL